MLRAMDEGIGTLLTKLGELGIEEDTLLFFINDNGGPTPANGSDNRPLRATKGTMYEGGIRVPFMVQWPSRLKAGLLYEHPVISLDILPTVAAAARAKLPTDRKIDGVNLLPYLTGEKTQPPHEMLFWRRGQHYAARKGNIKLLKMDGGDELYDLASDIGESQDLSSQRSEVLRQLKKAYEKWGSQMIDPLWTRQQRQRKKTKKKLRLC